MLLPLAEKPVPPTGQYEKPATGVPLGSPRVAPPKAVSSFPADAVIQVEEPLVPSA